MSLIDESLRLTPAVEQIEYGAFVTTFLGEQCDETEVRRLMADNLGYDPTVWRQACQQLGLGGLDIPEKYDGSGATFREVAVVMEALGVSLACLPFYSTAVLATGALLAADDEGAREEYLPGIASGRSIATLAGAGPLRLREYGTVSEADGDRFHLTGTEGFVVDGCVADVVLLVAASPEGPSLYAVSGAAPGLTRRAMETLDPTRRLARLGLERAPARLIGSAGEAPAILERVRDRVALAIACEQLGIAARALSMAVAYAKTRVQFGRPIGSFQAVKHRCVEIAQRVESARSAAQWGVATLSADATGSDVATAMATVCCSDAALFATAENIQVHGGIGFTWEHPAHLYFRRARSNALLHGADEARELLLGRLGV